MPAEEAEVRRQHRRRNLHRKRRPSPRPNLRLLLHTDQLPHLHPSQRPRRCRGRASTKSRPPRRPRPFLHPCLRPTPRPLRPRGPGSMTSRSLNLQILRRRCQPPPLSSSRRDPSQYWRPRRGLMTNLPPRLPHPDSTRGPIRLHLQSLRGLQRSRRGWQLRRRPPQPLTLRRLHRSLHRCRDPDSMRSRHRRQGSSRQLR
jgi:hypothetical protein